MNKSGKNVVNDSIYIHMNVHALMFLEISKMLQICVEAVCTRDEQFHFYRY